MHWVEDWRALAARIEGLLRAVEFYSGLTDAGRTDLLQVLGHSIYPEATDITTELQSFLGKHESMLPDTARAALRAYLDKNWSQGLNHGQVGSIAPLAILLSRFEYAIRDTEALARSQIELAFEHLRRQVAIDPHVRELWKAAFEEGERSCEKLGAVHLLGLGIWAFKISGAGAATDLVLNEPIEDERGLIDQTGRTMALTEWKLVRRNDQLEAKALEARVQASQYAAGLLGPLELKTTRYAVLVTSSALAPPPNVHDGGVRYRHIVLPVDPETPSVVARKLRRG